MTRHGAILGTVFYMSPEQVDGNEIDARSDIFSLGAVLYEMVTGGRAFQGKSEFSVASAILQKEPESITKLQPHTPPALERTIRVCLAKDPDVSAGNRRAICGKSCAGSRKAPRRSECPLQPQCGGQSARGSSGSLPSCLPPWPWPLRCSRFAPDAVPSRGPSAN